MRNPKYLWNYYIRACINYYYGRTAHYHDRGKYNKAYWCHYGAKRVRKLLKK